MIRCPACGRYLCYKKRAGGFVCKNWKCKNYWKLGHGPVFELTPERELREKVIPPGGPPAGSQAPREVVEAGGRGRCVLCLGGAPFWSG